MLNINQVNSIDSNGGGGGGVKLQDIEINLAQSKRPSIPHFPFP